MPNYIFIMQPISENSRYRSFHVLEALHCPNALRNFKECREETPGARCVAQMAALNSCVAKAALRIPPQCFVELRRYNTCLNKVDVDAGKGEDSMKKKCQLLETIAMMGSCGKLYPHHATQDQYHNAQTTFFEKMKTWEAEHREDDDVGS